MKKDKKIFVDRFTDRTYTMSMYDNGKYTTDIAVVNEYQTDNPYITFTTTATLTDVKDIIKEISHPSLDELAMLLIRKSEWKLIIAGHTDNVGNDKTNLILSKKRSTAVAVFLEHRGVSMDRLIIQYFGEEKPLESNDTKEGRQKNRRVEMTVLFE